MATYYVDDGGSNTSPYDTWAKAAPDIQTLETAVTFAAGDIVYIGHDSVSVYAGVDVPATGPNTTTAAYLISAETGTSPPVYMPATAIQIDTNAGARVTFSGAWHVRGVRIRAGDQLFVTGGVVVSEWHDVKMELTENDEYFQLQQSTGDFRYKNLELTLADTASVSDQPIKTNAAEANVEIIGLKLNGFNQRTGTLFTAANRGVLRVSGGDFSGLASSCEIVLAGNVASAYFSDCTTASTWTPVSGANTSMGGGNVFEFVRCGNSYSPAYLYRFERCGTLLSSVAILRSGGAAVDGVDCSWLITTSARCSEGSPLHTPWIYGEIASTGSKNFDVFITNDTADFLDDEVWLEVEYQGTASSSKTEIAMDRGPYTSAAAAQDDDTVSSWSGSGPSYTYKQRLRVTATVNQAGAFRARVAIGKTSIASSSYFYVDPKVTVS